MEDLEDGLLAPARPPFKKAPPSVRQIFELQIVSRPVWAFSEEEEVTYVCVAFALSG